MNTKNILSVPMLVFVTAVLLLGACAPVAPSPTAASVVQDPLSLVQLYYEAIEASDIETAMTFVSDDYVMTDPTGFTVGKEPATTVWKSYVDAGFTFDQSEFKAAGNRVTSCFKVYEKGSLIDEGCSAVTHVRDGQIIFDGLEDAEQIWVVQEYYEALNAKQLDLAMSYIASDAVFINPTGTYEGADAIRESLSGLHNDNITFALSNFRNTDGRVTYDYKVMQGANLLDQGTNGLTIVKDGKVVFDGTVDTDPLTATTDPAAVVQGFWDAMAIGDVETALTFLAEDAKCRGSCYISGKASLQSYLKGIVDAGFVTEISNVAVENDMVKYSYKIFREGLLVETGTEAEVMQVSEGKIIFWNNLRFLS